MKRTITTLFLLASVGFVQVTVYAQKKEQIISAYLQAHATEWKLTPNDVSQIEIVSQASSQKPGVEHVYIRQLKNQAPIVNGLASVALKDNQVVHVSSSLVSLDNNAILTPILSASQAVSEAFKALGLTGFSEQLLSDNKAENSFLFDKGTVSNENIPVRLFLESIDGKLEYVWDLSVYPKGTNNWWSMRISAIDGKVVFKNNWFNSCSFESCAKENHIHNMSQMAPPPPPPSGADQYNVVALPLESPSHGSLTTVVNPSDNTYSPFGWHDINGVAGNEFTISRGNNVYAYEDREDNNTPGYSPDGGSDLDFGFIFDSLSGVEGNINSVITNLFYTNNMIHDIWAYYGFDEASGNFQEKNYTNVSGASDEVMAEAQDGSGTDNANFGTPPDGGNPRMQMYLWNLSGYVTRLSANDPDSISGGYAANDASFGPHLGIGESITSDIVLVLDTGIDTLDGCEPILNGPALNGKIALIRRGNCQNVDKVLACQNYGAIGVIVMQPVNASPGNLLGSSPTNNPVTIPTIVVGKETGDLFVLAIKNGATVNVTLNAVGSPNTTDSDFDNGVIAHEYGHGISNRLVGGKQNTNCLYNDEQMGEGWSDWLGLMVTIEPGDVGTDKRGIGTYLINQPTNGTGIRPSAYSTNFALNNYTYGRTNQATLTMPHGIGFVWASMLWDLNWALVDEYGLDLNVKTGTGGNNKAMALVIEGMKLTSCQPGFVDARDGILAADELLFNGDNQCLIWNVFAKRGLGISADQGSSNDRFDQVEAFDIPIACGLGIDKKAIETILVYPNPGTDLVTIDLAQSKNATTLQVLDLTGKLVYSEKLATNQIVQVDLRNLKKGLYFISVEDESGVHVINWVKQ